MSKALSLEELKRLLQVKEKENLSCSLLESGIPKGVITEITGTGKTEFVLAFLREHPTLRVAWIEENFSVYPFGFMQRNVSLDRILFVESGTSDTLWSVLQVLKSQIFSVVVVYAENLDLMALRKIQLASEKSGSATLWLTAKSRALWPVRRHVRIRGGLICE